MNKEKKFKVEIQNKMEFVSLVLFFIVQILSAITYQLKVPDAFSSQFANTFTDVCDFVIIGFAALTVFKNYIKISK